MIARKRELYFLTQMGASVLNSWHHCADRRSTPDSGYFHAKQCPHCVTCEPRHPDVIFERHREQELKLPEQHTTWALSFCSLSTSFHTLFWNSFFIIPKMANQAGKNSVGRLADFCLSLSLTDIIKPLSVSPKSLLISTPLRPISHPTRTSFSRRTPTM